MIERIYTDIEEKLIYKLRDQTIFNCECNDGWLMVDGEIQACGCRKIFVYLKELVYARIPKEYWHLRFKDLQLEPPHIRTLFLKYLKNYETAIDKGLALGFIGNNGIGKTFLLCQLGKEAIVRGYKVIYVTTQDYISYKMIDDSYNIDRVHSADIILLDELDKPYRKKGSDYVLSSLENFFRSTLPKNKVVNIATNWKEEDIKRELGKSIYSIMLRKMKLLHILGKDKSREINMKWENSLVYDKIDYLDDYFLQKAERMKFDRYK